MSGGTDPAALIDLHRYPVHDLTSPAARDTVDRLRRSRAEKGVAILDGFLRPEAVQAIADEVGGLVPRAFREDVWGTPYLELPDDSLPDDHPRRTLVRSVTWVIAYDLVAAQSPIRRLYEWDPLMRFIGAILDRWPLYRYADPLGALNLTSMVEGDVQGWHYDLTDFVVSLALQSSDTGGHFECVPHIRSAAAENYDEVARVLHGKAAERIEVYPMTPGTLMIFEGRCSLHRVSPVGGSRPRYVALLAYDRQPGTDSSDLLKMVRYGRTAPIAPSA